MTFGAYPAWTRPQTRLTPARGSIRRDSTAGSSVMTFASANVRSSVRCGRRVAAGAGQPDLDVVGGAGERPRPQSDVADVEGGVAVQGEDALDVVERARA